MDIKSFKQQIKPFLFTKDGKRFKENDKAFFYAFFKDLVDNKHTHFNYYGFNYKQCSNYKSSSKILKALDINFTIGNDAPRNGWLGEYLQYDRNEVLIRFSEIVLLFNNFISHNDPIGFIEYIEKV